MDRKYTFTFRDAYDSLDSKQRKVVIVAVNRQQANVKFRSKFPNAEQVTCK